MSIVTVWQESHRIKKIFQSTNVALHNFFGSLQKLHLKPLSVTIFNYGKYFSRSFWRSGQGTHYLLLLGIERNP